jgi:hypothetical protein
LEKEAEITLIEKDKVGGLEVVSKKSIDRKAGKE